MLPNFKLKPNRDLSAYFIKKGAPTYHEAISYIKALPYGRNRNPTDLRLVLSEHRGTCSTKHAILKAVAQENNITSIGLTLGIYKMTAANNPFAGEVLHKYDLPYFFEVHTYLTHDGKRYDFTFPNYDGMEWEEDIFTEIQIEPEQIGKFKSENHRYYLKEWIKRENIPYSYNEIWAIREECIHAFTKNCMAVH